MARPAATTTPAAAITTMLDAAVYLDKLALFGRILRQEGLFVSPDEDLDAVSILLDLGLADRETVKAALRTVYAKSREQQLRFDRIFDSFFLPEDAIRAIDKKHQEEELAKAAARQQAEQDMQSNLPEFTYDDAQREAFPCSPRRRRSGCAICGTNTWGTKAAMKSSTPA